jgi:hypothetical protein
VLARDVSVNRLEHSAKRPSIQNSFARSVSGATFRSVIESSLFVSSACRKTAKTSIGTSL